MFKKLDTLIIKSFIGPFIATFFITLMVLLLQFFWLYIDDFVGKGLDLPVLFKFIWYQLAVLVTPALPLSILLSSLMTFGSLGESFELAAIKSAGISLLRFMRPVFILSLFVAFIAFLFTNYIMPVAFLKSRTLLSDIVFAKPAFDIQEGVFYDRINGFVLKIGKKDANDSTLQDIILYDQSNSLQDNFIIAKTGIMKKSDDNRYLDFILRDGWRYQEKGDYGSSYNDGHYPDFIRLGFKEYKTQFDISSFLFNQTPDSINKNNANMLNMKQLNVLIDSFNKEKKDRVKQQSDGINNMLTFKPYLDSFAKSAAKNPIKTKSTKPIDKIIPDSLKPNTYQQAINQITAFRSTIQSNGITNSDHNRNIRIHKIEWHRKIITSLACIILFFIGAPLGSIIRKGGLGTPLIISIFFFMLFYFSSTMGEKFSREDKLAPVVGMWIPIYILLPIGLFFVYKAMHDSQLFNKDRYYKIFFTLKNFFSFSKK